MASCPRLHPQRSFCRRAVHPCDNDKAAGGLFFPATTIKQQAGRSSMRLRTLQAGHSILRQRASAGGTAILCDKENWNRTRHRCDYDYCRRNCSTLPARWRCIDSRFQAQTCESLQRRGQNRSNPCIDSRFQAQTCESMQPRGQNRAIPPAQGSEALCRGRGMPDGQGLRTA